MCAGMSVFELNENNRNSYPEWGKAVQKHSNSSLIDFLSRVLNLVSLQGSFWGKTDAHVIHSTHIIFLARYFASRTAESYVTSVTLM